MGVVSSAPVNSISGGGNVQQPSQRSSVPILLAVPIDIASHIVLGWLEWHDISCLDIALCKPKQLVELMGASRCVTTTKPPLIAGERGVSFISWAVARRVRLSHLHLEPSSLISERREVIFQIASQLNTVRLDGRKQPGGWKTFVSELASTLTDLQLYDCILTPVFHATMASCPQLKSLTLFSCRGTWTMKGEGIPSLRQLHILAQARDFRWSTECTSPLPNLQRLHLCGMSLQNDDNDALLAATNSGLLESLAVQRVDGLQRTLRRIFKQNPNIEELLVNACPGLADSPAEVLADVNCRKLRAVELAGIRISPNLSKVLELCAQTITSLDIARSVFTSAANLGETLARLTVLKVLNLSSYDFGMPAEHALPQRMLSLEHLTMQSVRLSDNTIEHIVHMAPALRVLKITCPSRQTFDPWKRYTLQGVQTALRNLEHLQELGVDLPMEKYWSAVYPNVRIVRLFCYSD